MRMYRCVIKQEGRAIAKMTSRCTLYMDDLKIFVIPWLRPRLLFPKLLWAFVTIESMKVMRTKFEIRTFTCS